MLSTDTPPRVTCAERSSAVPSTSNLKCLRNETRWTTSLEPGCTARSCADDAGELRGEHAVEPTGIAGRKAAEQLNAPVKHIEQLVFREVGENVEQDRIAALDTTGEVEDSDARDTEGRNSTSPSSCQSSLWLRVSVKRARTRRPSNVLSAARSPRPLPIRGRGWGAAK